MKISTHFELKEFTKSSTAKKYNIDNTPSKEIINNLKSLAMTVLDPIRDFFGRPLEINSGYRCKELNINILLKFKTNNNILSI